MGKVIDFRSRATLNDEEKDQAFIDIDTKIQQLDNAAMDLLEMMVDCAYVLEDEEIMDIEMAFEGFTMVFKALLKDPTAFSTTATLHDWIDTLAAYDATTETEEEDE